jgi:hypothetical protein
LAPFDWDPARTVATISLVVLATAIAAYALFHLAGTSRWIYVVTATIALFFNCFVGVAQAFDKIPFLHAFAPAGSASIQGRADRPAGDLRDARLPGRDHNAREGVSIALQRGNSTQ